MPTSSDAQCQRRSLPTPGCAQWPSSSSPQRRRLRNDEIGLLRSSSRRSSGQDAHMLVYDPSLRVPIEAIQHPHTLERLRHRARSQSVVDACYPCGVCQKHHVDPSGQLHSSTWRRVKLLKGLKLSIGVEWRIGTYCRWWRDYLGQDASRGLLAAYAEQCYSQNRSEDKRARSHPHMLARSFHVCVTELLSFG